MKVFVLSDQPEISKRIRAVSLQEGEECPLESLLNLDDPLPISDGDAAAIFVALSPDVDHALGVLNRLHRRGQRGLVAVGPAKESQLLLQAIHLGACDFVDENNLEADCGSTLSRLHGRNGSDHEGRIVVVLAPSGGTGASTLAANLAVVLSEQHHRPLLVDMHMPLGDLASVLDLNPTHTMAELCQHADHMDRSMLERTLAIHDTGVKLLTAPTTIDQCAFVTAEGVREILGVARGSFSHIIIDLDCTFRPEQVEVLRHADVVLLMVRLSFASIRSACQAIKILADLKIQLANVRLVVGRYGDAKEVAPAKAEQALGMKIDYYVPEESGTVNRANNDGVPVVTQSPRSRVARSLADLATGVCDVTSQV